MLPEGAEQVPDVLAFSYNQENACKNPTFSIVGRMDQFFLQVPSSSVVDCNIELIHLSDQGFQYFIQLHDMSSLD